MQVTSICWWVCDTQTGNDLHQSALSTLLWAELLCTFVAMSRQVVFDNREVSYWDVHHGRILSVSIFNNYNIPLPSYTFLIEFSLSFANKAIDRELHPIMEDSWIENDVRRAEFFGHAHQCFDQLRIRKNNKSYFSRERQRNAHMIRPRSQL